MSTNPSSSVAPAAEKTLVLLVEDELLISELVQTSLEEADFSVVTARHGGEAVSLLDTRPIDALLTDVRLGDGPDGWAVARHARKLRPDLPVIYFSGHGGCEWAAEGVPKSAFLQKPLSFPKIARVVRDTIEGRA